jgi:ribonuclease P protein component
MTVRKFTFSKEERLCSKIVIDKLFSEGKTVFSYPYRFVFITTDDENPTYPVKVVFSVPRRSFKKAVDRNFIRRRMREAFRLEKSTFYEPLSENGKSVALMIVYTAREIADYETIHRSLLKGMRKMIAKINSHSDQQNR